MLPKPGGTLQVTVLSLGPDTCAENCTVSPRKTVAVAGMTVTVVAGGGGGGLWGAVYDDPQSVMTSRAHNAVANRVYFFSE